MAISQNPDIPPLTQFEAEIRDTFHLAPLPGDLCFYCGEEVSHPCIYWVGTEHIWLHTECVSRFMGGLLQDLERYIEWSNIGKRVAS